MSAGRLNTLRVVLAIQALLGLYYGISAIFAPGSVQQMLSSDPLTSTSQALITYVGIAAITLAVGDVIALLDPLKNRGLIVILVVFSALDFLLGTVYVNLAVMPSATVGTWISGIVSLIIGVVIAVAYPWGESKA